MLSLLQIVTYVTALRVHPDPTCSRTDTNRSGTGLVVPGNGTVVKLACLQTRSELNHGQDGPTRQKNPRLVSLRRAATTRPRGDLDHTIPSGRRLWKSAECILGQR
jgi:hypothetical protein